jgi:signal transduction histidine kinase
MIFGEADGLSARLVHSIFENRAGDLFISSISKGLTVSRFDDGKFTTIRPNLPGHVKYFGWGWKQTVWQDNEDAWWIPTGEGLFRFSHLKSFNDLSSALPEEIKTGAKGENMFRLFEDSHGDIWIAIIGYPSELLRWERANNTWHDYTQTLGLSQKLLGGSVFLEDRNGNLWIATGNDGSESGLIRYRDGNFKFFTKEEGAPPGWTRDLFLDHAGRLWLANTTLGLLRLDNLTADRLNFVRYTSAEGLSSNGIYCVTEDEFGRIYIGSGRGLDRLNPDTGQIENFTTVDGLPNSDVQVAYRDRKNALWFTTSNGLARFQPEPARQRKPPTVLITGLQVNGIAQAVSILGETSIPEFNLDSDQRQVNIEFIGLGATLGEKLRYEYRLTGGDWIQTNERTVNFANLSSGSYRFEIRAVTADRIVSQTPAVISFRIATPLWQRWWFIALITILIASAVYLIYRNRLARLLELERMRTRIATDLHDDIGANLTRISLLSEIAKQANGNGKMLSSIADIARESVGSMNDIVWAISPEHDSLLDLTRRMRQHAEEVFTFREINLQFNAPSSDSDLKLSVGVRRDLLLIFKEAVNNAARHSDCSQVKIEFRAENSVLSLHIKDNGKGIDLSLETEGQGLRSMTRRASSLGGKLKVDSHAGEGTSVEFELPLQKASRV